MTKDEIKEILSHPSFEDYYAWTALRKYGLALNGSIPAHELREVLDVLEKKRPGLNTIFSIGCIMDIRPEAALLSKEQYVACVMDSRVDDDFLISIIMHLKDTTVDGFALVLAALDRFRPHVSSAFRKELERYMANRPKPN